MTQAVVTEETAADRPWGKDQEIARASMGPIASTVEALTNSLRTQFSGPGTSFRCSYGSTYFNVIKDDADVSGQWSEPLGMDELIDLIRAWVEDYAVENSNFPKLDVISTALGDKAGVSTPRYRCCVICYMFHVV